MSSRRRAWLLLLCQSSLAPCGADPRAQAQVVQTLQNLSHGTLPEPPHNAKPCGVLAFLMPSNFQCEIPKRKKGSGSIFIQYSPRDSPYHRCYAVALSQQGFRKCGSPESFVQANAMLVQFLEEVVCPKPQSLDTKP